MVVIVLTFYLSTAKMNEIITLVVCLLAVILPVVWVVWRYRLVTKIWAILRLLDLLLTVQAKGRHVTRHEQQFTMAETFEICVQKYKDSDFCVVTDGAGRSKITFGEAEMGSSVVANWASSYHHQPGDVVAILMPNSCEFVVAMFGLLRAGLQVALVNTSLKGASLVHALTDALAGSGNPDDAPKKKKKVRAVLVSPDLVAQLQAAKLPADIEIVECGAGCHIDPWISNNSFSFLKSRQGVKWDDTCVYIYTSGTTGLPKASKMNNLRVWTAGCVTEKVCGLRRSDRLYCPLPLYHASGCTLGLVACLLKGSTFVTRSKFSASRFSADVVQHRCTSCQYIGEMARYLVALPPNELDGQQPLRFAYGNGMPTEVWTEFQRRYAVAIVNEFYAATEGNVNIFNNAGVVGACGIIPRGFEWLYPIRLFRHDVETGELVRDQNGLCVPCPRGEPGELLGLIKEHDPSRRFDGYADSKATERKIVRDVRKHGDSYFRSGDLLRQDAWGFLYFVDRVGDTFRWKGENVSTSEVARVVVEEGKDMIGEAAVYGVEVPGCPGRAGMAAIVVKKNGSLDWQDNLWQHLQHQLPRYAQPLFLRVMVNGEIEKTSTQKYKKTKLQTESFSNCGRDDVYIRDDSLRTFVFLDDEIKQSILNHTRKL